MIKLYHILREGDPFGGSRNGCKAVIALEEMGEKYQLVPLSRMEECRPADAAYRRINPNGVTPTIDDGGLVLWESSAILQYLGRKRPASGLLPTDEKALALAQQWLAWEGATLAPSLLALFFAATKQPEPVASEVEVAKTAYLANLKILDDALAGREYLAGAYSVADIACGALVPISFLLGLDLTGRRNIVGWLKRLRARPAWQRADAVAADMTAGEAQLR